MGNFVTGVRQTTARRDALWALLTDVDSWPATFTPHLKDAHLDGPLQVGATGWVKTRLPFPRSRFYVTDVDDGVAWSWTGGLLWLTMDYDHRLRQLPAGTTVTFDVDLNGAGAGIVRVLGRLVYRRQMERALDLLVELASAR